MGFFKFPQLCAFYVMLLAGCSKYNAPDIPDTGMYVSQQFTTQQLATYDDITYSSRPNYQGLQYTSQLTMQQERLLPVLNMKLDILVPPNATAAQKQPLVIFIHGGSFMNGDKSLVSDNVLPYALSGYITASINYRLTADNDTNPQLRLLAIKCAVEDAQNAVRFLKKNAIQYHIDTTRIAVMGRSAGGYLTLFNAIQYDEEIVTNDFPGISSKAQAAISTGATLVNEDNANGNGLLHYDAFDTPVLLFHAKETDAVTGSTWTDNVLPTQQLINNSGNQCIAVPQPDMTHTISLALGGDYWSDIRPFLWDKLRLDLL